MMDLNRPGDYWVYSQWLFELLEFEGRCPQRVSKAQILRCEEEDAAFEQRPVREFADLLRSS